MKDMKVRASIMLLAFGLLLSACTPSDRLNNPPPSGGAHRFTLSAEGRDALLGDYEETFQGNASYTGSLLQLWSDSSTPNRTLQVRYQGEGALPVGTYSAVGSEAQVTDPAAQVVVTYLLAQGAFCTVGCPPPSEAVADYYFEYLATAGTVAVTQASGGRLAGTLELRVERHGYHADLSGSFDAALGR